MSASHNFTVQSVVELLKFGGLLFNILSLTAIFLSQTENIQVAQSQERPLKRKIGFETYKDYFTDETHWSVIIFLSLVNITAQVNKGIYFGLCPQLDIYILFILYFMIILCIKRFVSNNWLMRLWDLAW